MKKPTRTVTATARRKSAAVAQPVLATAGADTDAVELLKADHRKVEELFEQYNAAEGSEEKDQFLQQICKELILHAEIEEGVFYPACREAGFESDILDEAQVEHDSVKILIGELLSGSSEDDFYAAKAEVLSEYVKHHVSEEEDPSEGILAKAQESDMDMSAMAERLKSRKAELMQHPQEVILRPPQTKSLSIGDNSSNRQENNSMARASNDRERDDDGRFTSDRGRGRSGSGSDDRDRDDRGRFMSDDDNGRGGQSSDSRYSSSSRDDSNDRDRDDQGRFMSDRHDRGGSQRDDYRGGSSYRSGSGSGRSSGRDDSNDRDRDDRGRFMSDDRGSRYGRDDDRYSSRDRGYRGSQDDDDNRQHSGWHGDSRGHSEAARLGWEHRRESDDDRDYGRSSSRGSSGRQSQQDDDDGRGWYGDSRGHSEAARLGWEHRREQDNGGNGNRGDSSRRTSSSSRDDDNRGGRGHGGWFGDSEGHSEAARRGNRNRD